MLNKYIQDLNVHNNFINCLNYIFIPNITTFVPIDFTKINFKHHHHALKSEIIHKI